MRVAGAVFDVRAVEHAQVQTAALGTDRTQSKSGAGRYGAAFRAVPADDPQRVPVRPNAQRPAHQSRELRDHETHTQPETSKVDVPAADWRRDEVHEETAGPTQSDEWCWPVVRHQAAVIVGQGWLWGQSVVGFWLTQAVVVLFGWQKKRHGEKEWWKKEQEKMYKRLFLHLFSLLYRRVFRLNAADLPPKQPLYFPPQYIIYLGGQILYICTDKKLYIYVFDLP